MYLNISNNIIITSSDYEYGSLGTYTVRAEVTNSKGDMISIQLPLVVEERSGNAPVVELTDYLIYAKRGEGLNYLDYFLFRQRTATRRTFPTPCRWKPITTLQRPAYTAFTIS